MGHNRGLSHQKISNGAYESPKVYRSNDDSNLYFEIGEEVTSDVAEAVSILMRKSYFDDPIWGVELNKTKPSISTDKCLFWLSGGDEEWGSLQNYSKPWYECYNMFNDRFGYIVEEIYQESETLRDVRDGFIEFLNLSILYDFAISENIIK